MWSSAASGLALTISIGGVTVGDTSGTKKIQSASFGAGRGDWFDPLSPASGTFAFIGTLTSMGLGAASSVVGASVSVACLSVVLWSGVVDTVVEDPQLDGTTVTTITATDSVGQLGQARVEDKHLLGPRNMEQQAVTVFGYGGLTVTVDSLPGYRGASLADINPLSGNVLSWITQAELDSNCIMVPNPTASKLLICDRGRFGDFGWRATDSYYAAGAESFWRMDEASGNLTDSGVPAWGFTATKVGTPTYGQTGPYGANGPKAILFTKSHATDEFTIGDQYDLTSAAWTVAGWVYWAGGGASGHSLMTKFATGPNNGWVWDISTAGALRFTGYNAGTATAVNSAGGAIVANTWTHIAAVLSGGTLTLYKNGVSVGSGSVGTIPNTAASLRFGSLSGSSNWYDGRMAMWGIWTSALTAAQLLVLITPNVIALTGALTPYSFPTTTPSTTIINHWILRQFGGVTFYSDAGSIASYGDHTFEYSSNATTALTDSYGPANRSTLKTPRGTVSAAFRVQSNAQASLVTMQPLAYVSRSGVEYQVMAVAHSITPDSWEVTLALAGTVSALTGGGSVAPS